MRFNSWCLQNVYPMPLRLKTYVINQPRFLLAIGIGMITINLLDHYLTSILIDKFFAVPDQLSEVISLNKYQVITHPLFLIGTLYFIFKLIKFNHPLLLSIITGIIASSLILLTDYFITASSSFLEYSINVISISALVLIWIILLQTQENLIKSLTLGYFAYLVIILLFYSKECFLEQGLFGIIPFFLSICLEGIVSSLFGYISMICIRILRVKSIQ